MHLFIPAFEGTWSYQSYLLLPSPADLAAGPGSPVTAKKWAMGRLLLADGPDMGAAGTLTFAPGVELVVRVTFVPDADGGPAQFKATGTGEAGPTQGTIYDLVGWAFPSPTGQLAEVRGSIRAVRGPDATPGTAGGMPVGTVGAFVMSK
jgi:hypothetical protein